jgi:hypothetical protein
MAEVQPPCVMQCALHMARSQTDAKVGVFFEHPGNEQSLLGNAEKDTEVPAGGAGPGTDGTLELLLAEMGRHAAGWAKGGSNGEEPIGQKYQ